MPAEPSRLGRLVDIATLGVLVLAAFLLVKPRLGGNEVVAATPSSVPLPARISALPVVDSTSLPTELVQADHPTLVFVFRSDCPACAAQRPEWIEIATEARAHGWHVTAVTAEAIVPAVGGYFSEAPVKVVQARDPMDLPQKLGVSVVPATIVIAPGGTIPFHRVGVMNPATLDSLDHLLRQNEVSSLGASGRR